ncbi:MAG TPA: hypothetical protein P5202_05605 [Methanomassiliicoccales archaeon]|nr:hypothetical protein [Methanomassiliicoccales archaeon]
MFGGRRLDRVRDARRISEIQDLIRTIAGNVDDSGKDMDRVKAMMKARAPPAPPRSEPPAPAPVPPVQEGPREVPPYQPVPRMPANEQPRTPPQGPYVPSNPPVRDRPVFCIHCGSRLPTDGSGCRVCASRNTRICPNCGTRVNASMVTCPICRRVMPPVRPYVRH